jgi:hypothetical protein
MLRDRFIKVMLVIIAGLLLVNLFHRQISPLIAPESDAVAMSVQKLSFRGNGVSIACSDNGQYVYAACSIGIFRSTSYGQAGTWEQILE